MAIIVPSGSIRFNTDSSKLELYRGNEWVEIDSTSPEEQTGGTRGVNAGGEAPGDRDEIQFINISSTGSECREYMMENNTKSKESFYRSSRNYYQRYQFKKKLDKYNSSPYFKDPCVVSNKFNRTVIFEKCQLHRAQNFFGKGKNARFTLISFCNVTT